MYTNIIYVQLRDSRFVNVETQLINSPLNLFHWWALSQKTYCVHWHKSLIKLTYKIFIYQIWANSHIKRDASNQVNNVYKAQHTVSSWKLVYKTLTTQWARKTQVGLRFPERSTILKRKRNSFLLKNFLEETKIWGKSLLNGV